jgi:hypothetical protein
MPIRPIDQPNIDNAPMALHIDFVPADEVIKGIECPLLTQNGHLLIQQELKASPLTMESVSMSSKHGSQWREFKRCSLQHCVARWES